MREALNNWLKKLVEQPVDTHKRNALKAALATLIFGKGIEIALTHHQENREIVSKTPIEFGFSTHIYEDAPGQNLTIDSFKNQLEILSQNNIPCVRFNIQADRLCSASPEGLTWNKKAFSLYDKAMAFAQEKGIKVLLVTYLPGNASTLTTEQYTAATNEYYTKLAQRYSTQVETWQIFNEPNVHNFRDYSAIPYSLTPEYLEEFKKIFVTANQAIKAVNPSALTTVNLSHWVGDLRDCANLYTGGTQMFDTIKDYVDIVTLDLYPDDNADEIKRLSQYVQYFHDRYHKPVSIGEIGLASARYDEKTRAKALNDAIVSLATGNVAPLYILIYELMDEPTAHGPNESSFGLLHADGTPKESFGPIMDTIARVKPTAEKEGELNNN